MRSEYILSFLRSAILSLPTPAIDCESIVLPNQIADLGSRRLHFELFASDFKTRQETERSAITSCVGSIAVAVPLGTGGNRADALAQALVDLFASYGEGSKRGAFRVERIVGAPNGRKASRLYVVGVERSNGAVVDGKYKIIVAIQLEIYEEAI